MAATGELQHAGGKVELLDEGPRVYDVEEVAARLRIKKTKAYDLIGSGAIRSFVIGERGRRVHPDDLADYIERCRQAAS